MRALARHNTCNTIVAVEDCKAGRGGAGRAGWGAGGKAGQQGLGGLAGWDGSPWSGGRAWRGAGLVVKRGWIFGVKNVLE